MLHELTIRNFAIIDDLHIAFGPGLNILTGETGAGKSIIIDALGLLMGDRGTAEWVRAGCELALVEAAFQLRAEIETEATDGVQRLLTEHDLEDPDAPAWLTLAREVRVNGRNVCRVNGRTVSLQILSEVASVLIDVHGQGEHLNLLQPRTHVNLLDRYANLLDQRRQFAAEVAQLRKVRGELQRLRQDARTIAQRVDLLNFQVEEIFEARLRPGEEEELENERVRLGNAESLMQLAQAAQALLNAGDADVPSVVDLLGQAVARVERLARIDPAMNEEAERAQALLEQVSDLARTLADYGDGLEFNPARLEEAEQRIDLLHGLKRKYGESIAQIVAFGEQAQAELESLANWEVRTGELEATEEKLLHRIGELGIGLSVARRAAGEEMARAVEGELGDLRMARARYGVELQQVEHGAGAYLDDGRRVNFDATGLDRVEFLLSANPGEPLKPLAKVASGGETARIMLALKSVLAHADATPTLIFDEIDQGIGGRVGATVGQKLWNLTGGQALLAPAAAVSMPAGRPAHQVLCITHLPQLAAFGDRHFTVNKRVYAENGEERTGTVVRDLNDVERIDELTQMLGASGKAGRDSVLEMVDAVQVHKRALVQASAG
ncbi:MAG: DNA repair protein RecN [Litorilinea sp.]